MQGRPRRWRRLASLPPAEAVELVRAQLALARAQLRVWTQPRGRLVTITSGDAGSVVAIPSAADRRAAERLALAVGRAAEHGLFRPQCLVRALALQSLLASARIHGARVRVGVRRDARGFAAHAWVELDGQALGEQPGIVGSLVELPRASLVTSA